MFKLASKSLAFSYRCSLVKSSALKNMNRSIPNSHFFSTFNVPNNDQLDKDEFVNKEISKTLLSKGKRILGMICVAGGLIHFDLNGPILLGGGFFAMFGGMAYHERNPKDFNWASRGGASMGFAGLWQTFATINNDLDFTSTFATIFPSTMLLTATVFGASSLYARYATRACAYRPAIVGTLAGMGMIALESGQIVPNTLMTALYTPEQLSLAYTYMCNTLPLLAITATGTTMGAIEDGEDRYVDILYHRKEALKAVSDTPTCENKSIDTSAKEEKSTDNAAVFEKSTTDEIKK